MNSIKDLKVKRGMLFLANLKGLLPSDYGSIKPVLVLQNNRGNIFSPCTIVVVSTGGKDERGLFVWDLDLVFTIDKIRFQSFLGYIITDELRGINNKMKQKLLGAKQP